MQSARQKLLTTLAHKSFRLGEFTLSSGGTSDYYIDCRTTTLDAKGARLTGEVFLAEIQQRGWKPRALGGLTMGADPIVVAVSVVSGEVDGFLVRKAEKQQRQKQETRHPPHGVHSLAPAPNFECKVARICAKADLE